MDPVCDVKSKEIKRACLNELIDYVNGNKGVLTEAVYPDVIKMVSFPSPSPLVRFSLDL